jgi:Mg2+ and Co2+ transporter CorA
MENKNINDKKITKEQLQIILISLRNYYLSLEGRDDKISERRTARYLEDLLGSGEDWVLHNKS